MTFVDNLSLITDLLILVPCLVFYTGFMIWINMRRKDLPKAQSSLREGATALGVVGFVIGLFAIWGSETWPLNVTVAGSNILASYDLFFFDVLVLLAVLLVAFAITVNLKLPTHFVGMMAVVTGFGVGFYGYRAYGISLTLDPLQTYLLYLAFAATSVLSYPATLYVDWFVNGPTNPGAAPISSDPTPRPQFRMMWNFLIGFFLLVTALAAIAAIWYGFDIAWAHLAAPP